MIFKAPLFLPIDKTKRVLKKPVLKNISLILLLLSCSCGSSEEGQISAALDNSKINWVFEKTDHFILFASEGSYASQKLPELSKKAEAAKQMVMKRLQVVKQEAPPTLIFLESREQMKEIAGFAAGGWTIINENGSFLVANDRIDPPLQHELGHLYSWRSWGDPAGYWLSEGVAVYASGDCAGEDLHTWAAKLALENQLTDFTDLEREFDFSKAAPHLQAGSFVKYIMEKYGVHSFRMLWENGLSASSEATGLETDTLLANWTSHIMQNEFTAAAQFLGLKEKIKCE